MILIVVTCVLLKLLFSIFCWMNDYFSLRRKLSDVPGPKSWPFIGSFLDMKDVPTNDISEWLKDLVFRYNDGMVLIWLGTEPMILVRKPHQLEVIMKSHTLIRKPSFYSYVRDWLGNGLVTSTGETWYRHRRLITPAFHLNTLDQFSTTVYEKAELLNEIIDGQVKISGNQPVNVYPLAIKFALDTVCKTVMGVDLNIQQESEIEYVKALGRYSELCMDRFARIWLQYDFIYNRTNKGQEYRQCIKTMQDFTAEIIHNKNTLRKNENQSNGKSKVRRTFLDLLMDLSDADENPFTLKEFREQVDTFMFGGHETTGTAISYALLCLSTAPEIQHQVQEEIDEVLCGNEEPDKQQLSQLRLLDRVIKESLRIFPVVPFISRVTDHEVIIDNHKIPKGVILNMNIHFLHHDPDVWEDPERFDPDRFLPENCAGRHAYSYVPFSAGPRNCIGQKFGSLVVKIALVSILRKWTVTSEAKIEKIKLISHFVLKPEDDAINLSFHPR